MLDIEVLVLDVPRPSTIILRSPAEFFPCSVSPLPDLWRGFEEELLVPLRWFPVEIELPGRERRKGQVDVAYLIIGMLFERCRLPDVTWVCTTP